MADDSNNMYVRGSCKNIYMCGLCQATFWDLQEVYTHACNPKERTEKNADEESKPTVPVAAEENLQHIKVSTSTPQDTSSELHMCPICHQTYKTSSNMYKHLRSIHKQTLFHPYIKSVKCSLCGCSSSGTLKALVKHLEAEHQIQVCRETLHFKGEENFLQWKQNMEKETKSLFVKKSGTKKCGGRELTNYYCHRSGNFSSRSVGKRRLKAQGTNKINGMCPAHMVVTKKRNGSMDVKFLKNHVGHTLDLGRVPLTLAERQLISEKLAQKIPIDVILDSVRDSIAGDKTDRVHLITRRDILNIKKHMPRPIKANDINHEPSGKKRIKVHENKERVVKQLNNLVCRIEESCTTNEELDAISNMLLKIEALVSAFQQKKPSVNLPVTEPPQCEPNIEVIEPQCSISTQNETVKSSGNCDDIALLLLLNEENSDVNFETIETTCTILPS